METIVLINANKTKSGKSIIHYGYQDPKERYLKGFQVLEQWLDNSQVYDNLRDEDFGQLFEVEFGYEDTYNGQARKVITTLVNSDGEVLFSK